MLANRKEVHIQKFGLIVFYQIFRTNNRGRKRWPYQLDPRLQAEHGENLSEFLALDLNKVWHYRLWSFKTRNTKSEIFLHKNQQAQRKLLNFENWTNGEPH